MGGDECPSGSACVGSFGFGEGYCGKICSGADECRTGEGYDCQSFGIGDTTCAPSGFDFDVDGGLPGL
jgi:hypothetical protein